MPASAGWLCISCHATAKTTIRGDAFASAIRQARNHARAHVGHRVFPLVDGRSDLTLIESQDEPGLFDA